MKRRIVNFLAWLGGLVLVAVVLELALLHHLMQKKSVPERTLLELDLNKNIVEYVPESPLSKLRGKHALTVHKIVAGLAEAAADPHVVGLVARVGSAHLGLADLEELRDAVTAFRKSGKPAVAFADTFGEGGPGNGPYFLATAFDEIDLQPTGDVGLMGMALEEPFLRGTLDALGVSVRGDHRKEYKTFLNTFVEKKFTPAHREADDKLLRSSFDQVVRGIAEARHLTPDAVRKLADGGPYAAKAALAAKLVDQLLYRDQAYDRVKAKVGGNAKLLYLERYLERADHDAKGPEVALVYGVGAIERGASRLDPLSGGISMGADTVAGALRSAIADKDVKAILFRVDSPGGSALASDTIWRETVRAHQAGKPVIVSMANVAASGGYYVAMGADKIVAEPGTITGSIGVVALKFVTAGLWNKLGVSWDELHTSANAGMWSSLTDFTPEGWAHLQQSLDSTYDDFTSKVAAGRHLSKDKVLAVAKGRVWTGEDAKALGLVDALGGFPTALELTRAALKLPAGAPLHLKLFPPARSTAEQLSTLIGDGPDNSEAGASVELAAPRGLDRLAAVAARLGTLASESLGVRAEAPDAEATPLR